MRSVLRPVFSPKSTLVTSKKYRCSCGSTYSRSDVLLRHLRACDQAQHTLDQLQSETEKHTRSKKACDRCAKSKIKCNSQQPCGYCEHRSFKCEYTRHGYKDLYEIFRAQDDGPSIALDADVLIAAQPQTYQMNEPQTTGLDNSLIPSTTLGGTNPVYGQGGTGGYNHNSDSLSIFNHGLNDIELDLEEVDWNSLMDLPESFDEFFTPSEGQALEQQARISMTPMPARLPITEGFELQQLDNVEAKCIEIRNFMQHYPASISDESITTHITRDHLLRSIQLYGKHYHPQMPILHIQTFDLTKTPPVLLLAMMIVGVCYSDDIMPATTIVQLAIHVLLTIEGLPHERSMQAPPLSVIQASALMCHILAITKNPSASQFASIHRGRMISMAERAELFCSTERIDYRNLSASTFDWSLWIDREMRRRLAHHIFVTEQGTHIFMRSSTYLSGLSFNVEMPCYQSCWVATTSEECLQQLQNHPAQIHVATALRNLRSTSLQAVLPFKASDRGMHTIIIGLHGMLSHAMEASLDHENKIPFSASSASIGEKPDLSDILRVQLSSHRIVGVADDLVSRYGSDLLRRANVALDNWKRIWDSREIFDIYGESNSAFSHPLNFYLLAKLFIVLHFLRNCASEEDFHGQQQDKLEFLNYRAAADGRLSSKIQAQVHVINWLSRLRRRPGVEPSQMTNMMSQVINTG